jgi:DNA (cytosine-5)-methyltransferase 1
LDGITFSAWRYQSLRGAGNAIVPGVVLQIFKTIERMERYEDGALG